MTKNNRPSGPLHKGLTVLGIVLCIILIPILLINCTLLIRGLGSERDIPAIGGVFPMIVLSDSMYPVFESGDLILCRQLAPEEVQVGDIITYFDPESLSNSVVTHRVMEITGAGDGLAFITRGDFNAAADSQPIPAENLAGVYTGRRIPGAGDVAMFMQTTPGLILCVGVPVVLLVGYDWLRRRSYEKRRGEDKAELLAELEELRRLKAERDGLPPES